LIESVEPFERELQSLNNACEIGISCDEYTERTKRLADARDGILRVSNDFPRIKLVYGNGQVSNDDLARDVATNANLIVSSNTGNIEFWRSIIRSEANGVFVEDSKEDLRKALADKNPLFFMMNNSARQFLKSR
jgi:hypothetical protein